MASWGEPPTDPFSCTSCGRVADEHDITGWRLDPLTCPDCQKRDEPPWTRAGRQRDALTRCDPSHFEGPPGLVPHLPVPGGGILRVDEKTSARGDPYSSYRRDRRALTESRGRTASSDVAAAPRSNPGTGLIRPQGNRSAPRPVLPMLPIESAPSERVGYALFAAFVGGVLKRSETRTA
jgi:hypothetical protein